MPEERAQSSSFGSCCGSSQLMTVPGEIYMMPCPQLGASRVSLESEFNRDSLGDTLGKRLLDDYLGQKSRLRAALVATPARSGHRPFGADLSGSDLGFFQVGEGISF